MRKLLAVVLALSLLIPVAVLADELDFYGAYSHVVMVESEHDAPFMSTIHFKENGTCYYCEQQFFIDRPGQSNAWIGTWEYTNEGEVLVRLGRTNSLFTLHFLKSGDLINTETDAIFNHVNAIWVKK